VLHGRPCTDLDWQIVAETDDYLFMQQLRDGHSAASLKVGTPPARRIA
jgi:hypothetical protein